MSSCPRQIATPPPIETGICALCNLPTEIYEFGDEQCQNCGQWQNPAHSTRGFANLVGFLGGPHSCPPSTSGRPNRLHSLTMAIARLLRESYSDVHQAIKSKTIQDNHIAILDAFELQRAILPPGRKPTYSEVNRLYGYAIIETAERFTFVGANDIWDQVDTRFLADHSNPSPYDNQRRADAVWVTAHPEPYGYDLRYPLEDPANLSQIVHFPDFRKPITIKRVDRGTVLITGKLGATPHTLRLRTWAYCPMPVHIETSGFPGNHARVLSLPPSSPGAIRRVVTHPYPLDLIHTVRAARRQALAIHRAQARRPSPRTAPEQQSADAEQPPPDADDKIPF